MMILRCCRCYCASYYTSIATASIVAPTHCHGQSHEPLIVIVIAHVNVLKVLVLVLILELTLVVVEVGVVMVIDCFFR